MAGTWQPLNNQPQFGASTMLLLTDGTVMAQAGCSTNWWKLVPDATGSYVNGSWIRLADAPNAPLYYASAVLADGRVFVAGVNGCLGVSNLHPRDEYLDGDGRKGLDRVGRDLDVAA